jgi:excisionase family DNA binding protein
MSGASGKPTSLDEIIGLHVAEAVREALSQTRPTKRLLTAMEAAEYLGLSKRHMANLTAMGAIPAVRSGRSVRYDLADLDEWIERNKHRE